MTNILQKGSFLLLSFFTALVATAQEKGLDVDIDINKKESTWYQQPWVWVVGAAVFIIILVAILRGGGRKD